MSIIALFFCLLLFFPKGATCSRVLIVVNSNSQLSKRIGDYYRKMRGIPKENVCYIRASTKEEIKRAEFIKKIKIPIMRFISGHNLQDEILYIVTTKGVPLKIKGGEERASVDSELSLIYREMVYDMDINPKGPIPNPYFGPLNKGFDHKGYDIYLVTRLTGYDFNDVKRLINNGIKACNYKRPPAGLFVFDLSGDDYRLGNNWLRIAARRLKEEGFSTLLEKSKEFLIKRENVMGYASWGSNDPQFPGRHIEFKWLPGAIASTFVSTNARTFKRPPLQWRTGRFKEVWTYFGGSPQSLIGDLIAEGITGVSGNVYEPYLIACVRPDILFPCYASGLNLAEAFYRATPFLSWQTMVVGDPLACPFCKKKGEYNRVPPIYFRQRRLYFSFLKRTRTAKARFFLAKAYLSIGHTEEAEDMLNEAIDIDKGFAPAYMALATIYMNKGDDKRAIGLYRRLLSIRPNYPLAMNNLAYIYAEKGERLNFALDLIREAVKKDPKNPKFLDTLGWVYYKRKEYKKAISFLKQALSISTQAIIYYHLGKAYIKLGRMDKARKAFRKLMETGQIVPNIKEVNQLVGKNFPLFGR